MELLIVRHGETAWTISGQHTGRTDVPLTERGRTEASALRPVLASLLHGRGALVYTSPSRRARETAALALPAAEVAVDPRLAEYDYGRYEGLTTAEIDRVHAGWNIWRDGCPGGESTAAAGARADACLRDLAEADPVPVVVFSHGHFSRILAARALGLPPEAGRIFGTATAAVSVVGAYRGEPCITLWNASAELLEDVERRAAAPAKR